MPPTHPTPHTQPSIETIELELTTLSSVMRRKHHVLMLLTNNRGEFILGAKNIYPSKIYRLVGGGIDKDESPLAAAQRELVEEMGIKLPASSFVHLASITAHLATPSERIIFVTELFYAHVGNMMLTPNDDLDGMVALDQQAYLQLVDEYQRLSPELDPQIGFTWADYGKLYAIIHARAYELYQQLHKHRR